MLSAPQLLRVALLSSLRVNLARTRLHGPTSLPLSVAPFLPGGRSVRVTAVRC